MAEAAPDAGFIAPAELPFATDAPRLKARVRSRPEDFCVCEELGYALAGDGVHAWLQIRKRDANTRWVAQELARFAGVRPADVGYAGLKDRLAVTTQWFSVDLARAREPDWSLLAGERLQVCRVTRHRRKLKRGGHRCNHFKVTLRDVVGDRAELAARLQQVARKGVPNYFGAQRFGRDCGNVAKALAMLAGERRVRDRHLRGLYLSAARSLLFNRVLAWRVSAATWDRYLPGDLLILDGRHATFSPRPAEPGLDERLAHLEVHSTGPLWGRGARRVTEQARALEDQALAGCESWCRGLEAAGLQQERRALRLRVHGLEHSTNEKEGAITVAFTLPKGAYATAVLRELVTSPVTAQERLSST